MNPWNSVEEWTSSNKDTAVVRQTLSDGSHAYGVRILETYLDCDNRDAAYALVKCVHQYASCTLGRVQEKARRFTW